MLTLSCMTSHCTCNILHGAAHSSDAVIANVQVNGHYIADLDPLHLDKRPMPVELDLALYGFSDKDLDRE